MALRVMSADDIEAAKENRNRDKDGKYLCCGCDAGFDTGKARDDHDIAEHPGGICPFSGVACSECERDDGRPGGPHERR